MLNLFNIIEYYKKLPHQNEALNYLQSIINKKLSEGEIDVFYQLWRKSEKTSQGYFIWMRPKWPTASWFTTKRD